MRVSSAVFNAAAAGLTAIAVVACGGGGSYGSTGSVKSSFVSTNLVSNVRAANNPFSGANVDANLVNAWGIAFNPQGFVWVANNGTSTATLYDGNGVPQSLVVAIPAGRAGNANPTGIVFNGSQGFSVSQGATTAPSAFLFAGEAGTISGWSPTVNMTNAIRVIDASARASVFKGLAIANVAGAPRLYATDFHNGTVAVWDENFARIDVAGAFTDATLPAGFAPFGIQAIGNQIYVSYVKQDAQAHDEVDGAGQGAVDVFDTSGNLVKRLVAVGGKLNAPWGMTVAPADFGPLSNSLLVGNFGDGKINAFDATTGAPLGTLSDANGSPIVIDGLWGLAFGNGLDAQPTQALFFSAGPAAEGNGVYGRIEFH